MTAIVAPLPQFFDITGLPLNAGYVWVGQPNQNPETAPALVYWDEALTQPAEQPLRTKNGLIVRSGTAAQVYVSGDYSIIWRNAAGVQIDYQRSAAASNNGLAVGVLRSEIASTASGQGDALVGVKSARAGSVARTQHQKNEEAYSLEDAGALGDGTANDGPALRIAAEAFGILGGRVTVPHGTYLTDATGGSCFPLVDPVSVVGDGGTYTTLTPTLASDADNTISIIPGATDHTLQKLEGLALLNPNTGARVGNHGIYLDTQTASRNLPILRITECQVGQGTNATGYGIYHLNNGTNNINGGLYGSVFDCNAIKGGIKLENSGDSLNVVHNVITGSGIGVYALLVAGASMLQVQGNNITNNGGAFRVDNGSRFRFLGNNCENIGPGATAQNDGAVVNITGSTGVIYGGIIAQNHIASFADTDATTLIRLRNCVGTVVENNVILAEDIGSVGIDIGSTCTNVRVGPNIFGVPVTTRVTDNGVGTMGVVKTATLLNSWVAFDSGTAPLQFIKSADGCVHLFGCIKSGTTTNGTLIATLPIGFRPTQIIRAPAVFVNGSAMDSAEVSVESDGSVRIVYVTANTQLNVNMTYPADGLAHSISLE